MGFRLHVTFWFGGFIAVRRYFESPLYTREVR
jgi:hypothetical protein